MKINKNLLTLGFCLIIVVATISTTMIYKGMLIDDGDDGDDDPILFSPPPLIPTPQTQTFPEDFFIYITNITFIKGNTTTPTENLTSLETLDGDTYDLIGNHTNPYEFEIEFDFDINQTLFSYYCYYDLFLYLDLTSNTSEIVYFQGFSNNTWFNITEIDDSETNLERYYLESTKKFRVFGNITSQKNISIDRFYILLAHNKDLEYNNHKGSRILYHREIGRVNTPIYMYDPDEWAWNYGEIIQRVRDAGSGFASTELHLELDLGVENRNEEFELFNHSIYFNWYIDFWGGSNKQYYLTLSLWDFTINDWVETHNIQTRGWQTIKWENTNITKYLNENNQWRVKIYSYVYAEGRISDRWSIVRVRNIDAVLKSDYPEIREITTIPDSPINYSESFELNTEVIPYANPIEEVSYFIENYSSDWTKIENIEFTDFWKINLSASAFENRNYTLWINATDSKGYYTLAYLNIEIFNARPRITIKSPSYLEKITQLYNYTLKIDVYDIESDTFSIPEFRIYKNASDPIINWTTMIQIDTHNFNYTIDPINFSSDFYTIQFRSFDWKGYGYNESFFLILCFPKSITILSPNETILTKPHYREIICNITDGLPIKTAQWDIVSDLNTIFVWKNLIYNPISELWEGNFNLTDYKWGNYYLVINATDSYNSSLEFKYLEFRTILDYYFTEISYISSPFTISHNILMTSDVIGNVKVNHHTILEERIFEVIIPTQYSDANNYYLIRDNIKYTPTQILNNTHTLWNISDYQYSDTIYFSLEKPSIINKELEEDDGGFEFEFSIISKYSFSNVLILNEIEEFILLDLYEIKLYYLLGDEWEKIDKDDYDLDADEDELELELNMLEIRSGITQFKINLIPKEDKTTKTSRWVATTLIASVIGIIPFQAYGLLTKSYKKMGKKKYLIISIALGVAGIMSGLFLSFFLY